MSGRRRVPFLAHTLAEYVVAAALIASGLHSAAAAAVVLVVSGAVLAVLNACTRGPLGALRLLDRRAHHVGDLLIVAILALSPLLALRHLHLAGVIVAEVVAVILLRIERLTRYGDAPSGASPALPAGAARGPAPPPERRRSEGRAGALALAQARRLGIVAGATRRVIRQHTSTPGAQRSGGGPVAELAPPERQ